MKVLPQVIILVEMAGAGFCCSGKQFTEMNQTSLLPFTYLRVIHLRNKQRHCKQQVVAKLLSLVKGSELKVFIRLIML